MRRLVSLFLSFLLLLEVPLLAGVGSKNARFVGGTVKIEEGVEGKLNTDSTSEVVFTYKEGNLSIPYDRINSLEYGQKAGRRVGLAILVSPFALFSKKRKHYLTVNYTDVSDKQQAVVFELGKDLVRTTLAILEARTGRKIEYQDDEARSSEKGN